MFVAAVCITRVPTSVEPVKLILLTRGSATSAPAVVEPGPGQHAERALGQAGLGEDLAERERGERGLAGRLHDGGVAAREGGRDLPRRDHGREVPRRDEGAHADRLPQRQVDAGLLDRDRLAGDLVRGAAPILEDGRDQADLAARGRDRLAAVAGLEPGEVLEPVAHEAGRAQEDPAPLGGGRAAPRTLVEGAGGDLHGAGGVLGAGLGHLGHRRAGRGLEDLEGPPRRRPALARRPATAARSRRRPFRPDRLSVGRGRQRHSIRATSTGSATPFRATARGSERPNSPSSDAPPCRRWPGSPLPRPARRSGPPCGPPPRCSPRPGASPPRRAPRCARTGRTRARVDAPRARAARRRRSAIADRGVLEGDEETVAGVVGHLAAVRGEQGAKRLVVPGEQLLPGLVADRPHQVRGPHDVGEHEGAPDPFGRSPATATARRGSPRRLRGRRGAEPLERVAAPPGPP